MIFHLARLTHAPFVPPFLIKGTCARSVTPCVPPTVIHHHIPISKKEPVVMKTQRGKFEKNIFFRHVIKNRHAMLEAKRWRFICCQQSPRWCWWRWGKRYIIRNELGLGWNEGALDAFCFYEATSRTKCTNAGLAPNSWILPCSLSWGTIFHC